MNVEKAIRIWKPIYLHFTAKYDVFESKNKINISEAEFKKRESQFHKFAKLFNNELEAGYFLVANYISGNFEVPWNIGKDDLEIFIKWKGRRESITKIFSDDIALIEFDFSNQGYLFKKFITRKINPETLVLLDKYHTPFIEEWYELNKTSMWSEHIFRLLKYRRFVKHDENKIRNVIESL